MQWTVPGPALICQVASSDAFDLREAVHEKLDFVRYHYPRDYEDYGGVTMTLTLTRGLRSGTADLCRVSLTRRNRRGRNATRLPYRCVARR